MELYFDNAAAMKPDPAMTARLAEFAGSAFFNQEALASPGAKLIEPAEKKILAALCSDAAGEYRVWFVNTGTDAVRIAFDAAKEILRQKGRSHGNIALSGGEHASVKMAASALTLEQKIFSCDRTGFISADDYRKTIDEHTRIAVVHFVQPETGIVQDLVPVRDLLDPDSLLLVDSIQGAGKILFDFKKIKPDFFTVSGQKLGVLNGGAVICRKEHFRILQKLRKDEHKFGRLNPFFALVLAECLEDWCKNISARANAAQQLKDQFFRELDLKINGKFFKTVPDHISSPYIAHLLLNESYQGAIIVRALSAKGIFVASGSACDAETNEPSAALRWMRIPAKQAFSALRISFSPQNDSAGVSALTDAIAGILSAY